MPGFCFVQLFCRTLCPPDRGPEASTSHQSRSWRWGIDAKRDLVQEHQTFSADHFEGSYFVLLGSNTPSNPGELRTDGKGAWSLSCSCFRGSDCSSPSARAICYSQSPELDMARLPTNLIPRPVVQNLSPLKP